MSSNPGEMTKVEKMDKVATGPFVVKKYSSRSYKLSGDTFKFKSDLDELGWYKKYLKGGPGYIIPNKNYPDLVKWLKKISGTEGLKGKPKPKPKPKPKTRTKPKPTLKHNPLKLLRPCLGLGNLSTDIARMILSKSKLKEILNMCSVNKYYRDVVCNQKEVYETKTPKNPKPETKPKTTQDFPKLECTRAMWEIGPAYKLQRLLR